MQHVRKTLAFAVLALTACSLDAAAPDATAFNVIAALSGNAQTGEAGSALRAPLVVRITNAKGQPLPGVDVDWTVTSGKLLAASTGTDNSGIMRVYWTLGTSAGPATATATAPGLTVVSFSSTVRPGSCTSIELDSVETALEVGDELPITVNARDVYSNAIVGRTVSWTSSNPAVAAVDANGKVTALATGEVTISAILDGRIAEVTLTIDEPTTTIVINNQLVRSINLYVNNEWAGVVNGFSSAEFVGPRVPIVVSYALIRQTTTSGTPIGSALSATFGAVNHPRKVETFAVNNRVGVDTYFVPFIDNQSPANYLMGVNMSMPTEARCDCIVPAGMSNVEIGYYKLYGNSNVRAYADASSYTGDYVGWNNFALNVGANTGYLPLSSSIALQGMMVAALNRTLSAPLFASTPVHDDDVPAVIATAKAATVWRQTVRGLPGIVLNQPVDVK